MTPALKRIKNTLVLVEKYYIPPILYPHYLE